MKVVRVAAAVILDGQGHLLASQRGYGEFQDGWEFPGGKIEDGETPREALKREIGEELSAEVGVGELLTVVEHDYPSFHLSMHCFICTVISGMPVPKPGIHKAVRWLSYQELDSVTWLPADIKAVEACRRRLYGEESGSGGSRGEENIRGR